MRRALTLAVVVVALSLTGCAQEAPVASPSPTEKAPTSTPTADPVRPALSELVAFPGGLDYVKVGVPVDDRDPAVAIITYNSAACSASDSNRAVGWEPSYENEPFTLVTNPDMTVRGILIGDPAITTAEGIGAGATRAELVAAYPSATLVSNAATDTYSISGPDGVLNIELATARDLGDYTSRIDTVLWMVAASADMAGAYYAYGAFGPCI